MRSAMITSGVDGTESSFAPWTTLEETTRRQGEGTALISCHQPATHLEWLFKKEDGARSSTDHLEWTYSQLMHAAAQFASRLSHAGLSRGDILMAMLPNCAEQVLLLWACMRLGVAFAPINPGFLDRPETGELQHIFTLLQPACVVTSGRECTRQFDEGLSDLDESGRLKLKLMLHAESESTQSSWITAEDMRQTKFDPENHSLQHGDHGFQDRSSIAVLLSTSGTTDLPKMCPHTVTNLDFESRYYYKSTGLHPGSKELGHGPNFHIAAIVRDLMVVRAGATLVLPSPKFDAGAIFRALTTLRCTHMGGVPSVLTALVSRSDYPEDLILEHVRLYGEPMSTTRAEHEKICTKAMKIVNNWGMTEGVYGIVCKLSETPAWHNGIMSCGSVMPGTAAKVCSQGSSETVACGELGELHVSGSNMIQGYYEAGKIVQQDSFYTEYGKTWFKTGDTVTMDTDGNVFVTGRYKDLIIRGGENIHPRLIERCLDKLMGVKSQVIGVDDSGSQTQSIHAVIRVSNAAPSPAGLKAKVQQLVLNELGPAYALSAVHLLSELGFRDYPATATGKVRKTELREKVKSLSLHSEIPAAHDSASSKVISIWCELLGSSVIDLDGNTPMSQFADSLVSLRFCLQVEKRFGKRITPADLAQQETPHAQARFLERQVYISGGGAKRNGNASLIRQQPFSTDQSWISTEDWNKASLCLSRHGLDWDDVESVYQPGGSMPMLMIRTTRKASVNVRWAWRVKEDSTPGDILECVIWALERHQALRAILAPLKDNTTNPPVLHLAMKPTKKCLDKMIMEADPIRESDAAGLVQSLAMPSAPVGSPALQARVIPVIGSSNPVLFIAANHAVFDAMSFGHFKEDLERRLLGQHAEISDWIPYSVFADMYRVYEGSGVGEKNTAYHVSKLRKQLRNVKPCLWPTMKGPGLMTGHDDHWRHDDMTIARPGERTTLDSGEERGKPEMRIIPLPDLPELQRLHDVVPSTVLKAAVAIVNVEMTGQDRAVFSHTDVGRRWPFMEPWIEQQLPNVMHVAGPTLEWNFDFIDCSRSQTAGELMTKVAEAQKRDIEHCHSPLGKIIERLGKHGDLLREIAVRQVFNWDSSMPQAAKMSRQNAAKSASLEKVGVHAFLDVGVYWNCGLITPKSVCVWSIYDDSHVSRGDMEGAVARIAAVSEWLSRPAHWGEQLSSVLKK